MVAGMVVGDSSATVHDVVFVVETTANLGAYVEQLKAAYIQPALEFFNGGPPEEIDYGCEQSCSLFGLVSYNGADCSPESTSRCAKPTTSIYQFLKNLMSLPYVGGCGDGTTFLSEGLATALQLFDDLKNTREPSVNTQKHCILLCNSAPCVLPSQESIHYNGIMAEDLINKLSQRDINFSIISPRKIPGLYALYDKNLTDHQLNTGKNYAVDSRHLVLLRGFQLEERPTSPGAKIEESSHDKNVSGIPPNQVAPGQRYGTNPQASFKVPTTVTSQGEYTNAKQTAEKILDTVRNRVQTTGRDDNMTSMSNPMPSHQQQPANVSLASSVPNYPNPQNPGMPNMGGMRHPHPSIGASYPTNMGGGAQMHGGGGPVGANNLPHPGPGGPMTGPGGPMTGLGPGGLPMPGVTVAGGQDVMNAMSEAAQMQQKKIIWKGILEWQEKTKQQTPQGPIDTGNKITRTLGCHVSLGTGEANINAVQWPAKLQMQLIPQNLLQPLHGLFKNSRTVSFTFSNHEVDGLRSLYKVMASGFAGCVHIPSSAQSDVRVLMLLYSNRKKQFMGLIPNDQAQFINGIRTVITTQRQMHHKKMQGPGVPGQPPFPGPSQPNMANPGQVGMGMPNVSIGDQGNQSMNSQQPGMNMPAGGGNQQNHSMVSMASSQPPNTGMAGQGSADMSGGQMSSQQQQQQQPPPQQQQPPPGMKGQQQPPQQPHQQQQQQQQQQGMGAGALSQEEMERRSNLARIEALKKNLNALEAKEMQFQQQHRNQQMHVPVGNSFPGQGGPGQQGAPPPPPQGPQGSQGLTPQQQLQRLQHQQALQSSNPQLRHLLLSQQQLRQQQMLSSQQQQQQQQRGMAPPPQGMMNQGGQPPNMGGQMQQRPPNFGVNEHFDLMN